jgi:hypothetical protein
MNLSRVTALCGVAPSTRLILLMPRRAGSTSRFSTSTRASGTGRGAVGGAVTISGLEVGDTAAELVDGSTLGSLCEHPASPKAATAVAALSATDRCRCIHTGRPGYSATPDSWTGLEVAVGSTGAMEVTVGNIALMTATTAMPVARAFAVTGCPFGGPKSTPRLPAGATTQLFTAFDYTHEQPMAGSVEASTASIRGGKGAQHG